MLRTTTKGLWIAVISGMAGTCATSVLAQAESQSKAPIDITANELEVVQSKCLAVWRGNAEALQGDSRLRADLLNVYAKTKSETADGKRECGGTDHIEAQGRVFYVTPKQTARADHAVYSQAKDQIVMTGNVVVAQGNNVARGDRLTIKVSSKEAKLESDEAGGAGRVRGVFYPDKSGQDAAAAKPQGQ